MKRGNHLLAQALTPGKPVQIARAAVVLVDMLVAVIAVGFIGLGGSFAAAAFADRLSATYRDAPECRAPAQALHQGCWARVGGTVVAAGLVHDPAGSVWPTVVVSIPSYGNTAILEVVRPPLAFYGLAPGQSIELKTWNGRVTAVFVINGPAMRTADSPYQIDPLRESGGLSLIAMGAIIIAVHPPLGWRRQNNSRAPQLGQALRDPRLALAFSAFALLQGLDIATSIKGGAIGLFEGNPTAAAAIRQLGPVAGFLVIKIPSVIAVTLVLARLPRRVALVVTWCGSVIMVYVVMQNVGLILSGTAP